MNVFNLRNTLIQEYADYIKSFMAIQDSRIKTYVDDQIEQGILWPSPLLQLNPNFEPGAWIDELAQQGILHPRAKEVFRLKNEGDVVGKPMRLHRHQSEAVQAAASGDNYILTTGTGSGKSLSYIVPIVNHVLQRGSGRGIQAIIVYPMNALANSQMGELEKFLGTENPAVTFKRYTGQESDEQKKAIIATPPDILLTNYVMLELILTRPDEKKLVTAMKGLQFLVLDELHTYRGRQGADVALLVRRVRNVCESQQLQCVGTSATLAEGGTFAEQQQQIATVASKLFGTVVKPERIIGETLRRATPAQNIEDGSFITALRQRLLYPPTSQTYDQFVADPLSIWIETTFGLTTEPNSNRLKRAVPISLENAAEQLAQLLDLAPAICLTAIQEGLMAGYTHHQPETNFPVFAFRLHQFIGRGDTVYASLEEADERYITVNGQEFVPGTRQKRLFELCFCRECGQEYYTIKQTKVKNNILFESRSLRDQMSEEDEQFGFLYRNTANPWADDEQQRLERLPEDWLEADGERVKSNQKRKLPQTITINELGEQDSQGLTYQFIPSPFPFCLNCGVTYSSRDKSDFAKLSTLSSEGRSTATTILSLSALRLLKQDTTLELKAKKLLSFTDNRQDASLQAGHFNDFVEVGLLRSALYQAVKAAGSQGLEHDKLPLKLFETLNLSPNLYAVNPEAKYQAKQNMERAMRDVLAYRVYQDLRRGWRITTPNLEQCGLLQIEYLSLNELCATSEDWTEFHPLLVQATPEVRYAVCKTFLDYLRRELAIKVDYLNKTEQESLRQNSNQHLIDPWAIEEDINTMVHASIAFPKSRSGGDSRENFYVSPRGGLGAYLRRSSTFPQNSTKISLDETARLIRDLFKVLEKAGLTEEVAQEGDVPGYQIPAASLRWLAGDGLTPFHDPIRMPRRSNQLKTGGNRFFTRYYQEIAQQFKGVTAREHTAQVPSAEREKREKEFRSAELPILYCSPTMELGVDISQLNVVNMRNVPPTPANYAQRSGRAGRSGQPALVFTYCTTGSPHDQYFFKRPAQMVAGAVATPRLDLANEDLIRAHVQAVWLSETGLSLGSSLRELLKLDDGTPPSLALHENVLTHFNHQPAHQRAGQRLLNIFESLEAELKEASWYTADWLEQTLKSAPTSFDQACERWRNLYHSAFQQQDIQNKIVMDPSRSKKDREAAERLRREAERQRDLLLDTNNIAQSDFYSYRYFASEGFLPGYNFPRLPLSAYIPARRGQKDNEDEYLSRPRFLAISEFGPRSMIYHEGSRYEIVRVILPVGDVQAENQQLLKSTAQICLACGYLHALPPGRDGLDRCENCKKELPPAITNLFRMQNVSTRRRERINSDEEERFRMGYDLQTVFRFEEHYGRPAYTTATVQTSTGQDMLHLTYGNSATIWRINQGWRRRKNKAVWGFTLDVERGKWEGGPDSATNKEDEPLSARREVVVPFVADQRNCLLLTFEESYNNQVMASLQPALKNAIQVLYQLEDNELAAEPLPSRDDRRSILFYESAEGGAGVLRQLVSDPQALKLVARKALELCHFNPDTRQDLRHTLNAKEDCEAACYDCLMSYNNQLDHRFLDRKQLLTPLYELSQGVVHISPNKLERETHLTQLKRLCDSDLERSWLDFLQEQKLNLPDEAQYLIKQCQTRADFFYRDKRVAIYIDGPHHDTPEIAARDQEINACLIYDLGLTVLRFRYDKKAEWAEICANHSYLFGKPRA